MEEGRLKETGACHEDTDKAMVLQEMKEEYSELSEVSQEELRKMVQDDAGWMNIFLDKLFGRVIEYDPEACLVPE